MEKINLIESIKECSDATNKAIGRLFSEISKRYPKIDDRAIIRIIMSSLCDVLVDKEISREQMIVAWIDVIVANDVGIYLNHLEKERIADGDENE